MDDILICNDDETKDFSDCNTSDSETNEWLFDDDDDDDDINKYDDDDDVTSIAESTRSLSLLKNKSKVKSTLPSVFDKLHKSVHKYNKLFKQRPFINVPLNKFEYTSSELYIICYDVYIALLQNIVLPKSVSYNTAREFNELCNRTRLVMKSKPLDQAVNETLMFRFALFSSYELINLIRFVRVQYLRMDKSSFKSFQPIQLKYVKHKQLNEIQSEYILMYEVALQTSRKCAVFMFNTFIRFIKMNKK